MRLKNKSANPLEIGGVLIQPGETGNVSKEAIGTEGRQEIVDAWLEAGVLEEVAAASKPAAEKSDSNKGS